jgi:hypothetical protein
VITSKRLTTLLAMVVLLGGQMVQAAHIHSIDYFDAGEVHTLSDCAVCYCDANGDNSASLSHCGFASLSDTELQKVACLLAPTKNIYSQSTARGPPH